MKKTLSHQELTRLAVPTVAMPHHEARLKYALLSSHQSHLAKPNIARSIQKGWNTIMAHKKIMMGGAALGAAVVGLTVASLVGPMTATASAQGMARQGAQALTTLSPVEQAKIQARTSLGIATDLQAAQAAKDARALSYTEAAAQYPALSSTVSHDLAFVGFTRDDGAKVLIGLDRHRLPVYELVNDTTHGNAASVSGTGVGGSSGAPSQPINGTPITIPVNGTAGMVHN